MSSASICSACGSNRRLSDRIAGCLQVLEASGSSTFTDVPTKKLLRIAQAGIALLSPCCSVRSWQWKDAGPFLSGHSTEAGGKDCQCRCTACISAVRAIVAHCSNSPPATACEMLEHAMSVRNLWLVEELVARNRELLSTVMLLTGAVNDVALLKSFLERIDLPGDLVLPLMHRFATYRNIEGIATVLRRSNERDEMFVRLVNSLVDIEPGECEWCGLAGSPEEHVRRARALVWEALMNSPATMVKETIDWIIDNGSAYWCRKAVAAFSEVQSSFESMKEHLTQVVRLRSTSDIEDFQTQTLGCIRPHFHERQLKYAMLQWRSVRRVAQALRECDGRMSLEQCLSLLVAGQAPLEERNDELLCVTHATLLGRYRTAGPLALRFYRSSSFCSGNLTEVRAPPEANGVWAWVHPKWDPDSWLDMMERLDERWRAALHEDSGSLYSNIASFYWLFCQSMPFKRHSSAIGLQLLAVLCVYRGLPVVVQDREYVYADCVALSTAHDEFVGEYFQKAFEQIA